MANLEEGLTPRVFREDYVPTGFRGAGVKSRAIKGHEFGFALSPDEKASPDRVYQNALII